MSANEGPASPTTGTSQVMDHMGPGAAPSSREYDGRDAGDVDSARAGVDLLFAAIGSTLCTDASPLALDRDRLLWGIVDHLRSHVSRLEARLDRRLKPSEDQEDQTSSSDDDMDAHDAEFLPAHHAENIQNQISVLREALEHGLNLYGQTVGRPWLARQGSLDAQFTDASYGAQIDAVTFFATREDRWKPAPDTLARAREAADDARDKRAALRASASARDSSSTFDSTAEEVPAADTARSLDAAAQMFHALTRIYPDGTQLQDERAAGAWRIVRMLDANAELSSDDAFRRMRHHPAFGEDTDDQAIQDFDNATRASLVRTEYLAQATDAAAALYLETTEDEWKRDDPAMSVSGGPRTRTTLTGTDYASAKRAAELGHPAPLPLDGPHILVVGDGDLAPQIARDTVVPALNRLHERIPEMVLHYGARLRATGGKPRLEGVDPAIRRWATGRRVPLVPNPPRWDPEHKRYNIHARDDAWMALKPDLIVDFGGRGNAHNRLLTLANNNGILVRTAPARVHTARPAQGQAPATAPSPDSAPEPEWLGLITTPQRLFHATQSGWLPPLPGTGTLLGHETFVSEARSSTTDSIPVRLTFDPDLIPFPQAWRDLEQGVRATREGHDIATVQWRAPLPMSAVTKIEVASQEHKTRLLATAHDLSEFSLPPIEVEVSHPPVNPPTARPPEDRQVQTLQLPDRINSIQGAMAMAAWSAPDSEPWTELLNTAMSGNAEAAAAAARALDADWLKFPWLSYDDADSSPQSAGDQNRLWRAAVECMQPGNDDVTPTELAERIALAASVDAPNPLAEAWLHQTRRLLAHEERLSSQESLDNGPGLAIQLALLQPGSVGFRTWTASLPNLPAPAWCAASTLCGWRLGYRLLPRILRGTPEFQRTLSTHALAASWPDGTAPLPPTEALAAEPPDQQTPAQPPTEERPLRWAGIGSRKTPDAVLADMTELSRQMAAAGFHLSSGGAKGADTAFAAGTPAEQRTIWLPRPGFEGLRGPDCHTLPPDRLQECLKIAERLHPAWHRCDDFARRAHARNVAILLGPDLDNPVDAVVCWTENGKIQGGTGLGLLIAREWKIPVLNLATLSRQQALTQLQRLHQSPAPERTLSATELTDRHADREQRHALRERRAVSEVRAMRAGQPTPSRAELARQHEDSERLAQFGRLYQLTSEQLETALTRITEQMVSLDQAQNARAPHHPLDAGIPVRLAALKETYLHTTQALIFKVSEERETEALAQRSPASITRERALAAMHSLWRLTEEGPLATEPNRLLREAAKAFNAQHRSVDDRLAVERRERAGLNLENTPGSEREHLALARSEPGQEQTGEAFEYMLSPAELHERDQAYQDLVARSEHLSLAASTADLFAKAGTVDMSRRFDQRDQKRTRHLEGANTPEEIQQRHSELRAAHRQLIDNIYANLASLCPDDHPCAAEANDLVASDRDMLLSRFAAIFRTLEREVDKSLQHISRTGKGANRLPRLRETASYLRELSAYAEKAVSKWTDLRPHAWVPTTTQSAGDWLMERQRRARQLHKTETLAPDGRHLAIVGGRSLGRQHAHRITELLNAERARIPDTPLVIHCINHEGVGLHAAEWAAMHGVACVTHRPATYAAHHLQDRDTLLLGIPPATLWTFGTDKDRAASELVEAARNAPDPIEIRNMEPDMDGPLSHDILIDPPEIVDRECARIREAWEAADVAAGETALIYQPGIESLKPDINRVLTSPHLTPGDRSFLTAFKAVLDSETRVRGEIDHAISRGREHLAHYQAVLERQGPINPGTSLKTANADYRRWDIRAEQIVKTFDNWFANDDPSQRDHIDRKRVDLVDIAEELRAVRKAARSPDREPHQVGIPLDTDEIVQDQRIDRTSFSGLMRQALLPEDERDPRAVFEFARQSRAWPTESLSMLRDYLDRAAQTGEPVSTRRISHGLPPALAAGITHISEEIWTRQAAATAQRQAARHHGRSLSA